MTPEQITRNFICDPAILNDAKLAVSGLDSYPALSKFLQAKPLDSLMFFANQRLLISGIEAIVSDTIPIPIDDDKAVCGGLYNPWGNLVAINAGYKRNQRVQERHVMAALFSKPDTVAVAPLISFTVPLEHVDTVLMIHEISHMVDFQHVRQNKDLAGFVREAALSAYGSRRFVSRYAGTQPDEWFAETMSAYIVYPEVLKDFDPLGFAAMKAALEL